MGSAASILIPIKGKRRVFTEIILFADAIFFDKFMKVHFLPY